MKFTVDEITLCKKIAEKHRKEIKYGDWVGVWAFPHPFTKRYIANTHVVMPDNKLTKKLHCLNGVRIFKKNVLPLWQISDCLEFLYERYEEVGVESLMDYWEASVYLHRKIKDAEVIDAKGKTPLEACLKAVLAIVEEEESLNVVYCKDFIKREND